MLPAPNLLKVSRFVVSCQFWCQNPVIKSIQFNEQKCTQKTQIIRKKCIKCATVIKTFLVNYRFSLKKSSRIFSSRYFCPCYLDLFLHSLTRSLFLFLLQDDMFLKSVSGRFELDLHVSIRLLKIYKNWMKPVYIYKLSTFFKTSIFSHSPAPLIMSDLNITFMDQIQFIEFQL